MLKFTSDCPTLVIKYLLTIQSYATLYLFIENVIFYQAKLLMFYDVAITYSTFASKTLTHG